MVELPLLRICYLGIRCSVQGIPCIQFYGVLLVYRLVLFSEFFKPPVFRAFLPLSLHIRHLLRYQFSLQLYSLSLNCYPFKKFKKAVIPSMITSYFPFPSFRQCHRRIFSCFHQFCHLSRHCRFLLSS